MTNNNENFEKHIPVLLHEVIDSLNIKQDGIYVDMTLGRGGHANEVLKKLNQKGLLIGIDQDEDAIKDNTEKFKNENRIKIVKSNFKDIKKVLSNLNIKKVNGIYFDLGVSSVQFDDGDRGFSYKKEAILDMRMDKDNPITLKEIINTYDEDTLCKIINEYGEEKFARSISKNIVKIRATKEIETTTELSDIIINSIPAKLRYKEKKHPAKRTFQAFRIYINDELGVLEKALDDAVELLDIGGRLSVITFHSLEDRIVKNKFKTFEDPCTCDKNFPCVCGKVSLGKIINKKVIVPTYEEIEMNNRSRSAKLRVFERR